MTRALGSILIAAPLLIVTSSARATDYYIDDTGGSNSNAGTSSSAAWQTAQPLEETTLHPGDRVLFKAGGTHLVTNRYATDGWDPGIWPQAESSGAEGNPVTFTSYGTGPMPIITNANDMEGASAISLRASWVVIDGLAFANTHDTAIVIEETASHVTVQNCETNRVGAAVTVYGDHVLITHNYFHDGTMIHVTEGGDDDYGANGVIVAGSYLEVSYNRAVHLKDYCPDFGEDGGFIELYGGFHDVNVHHNIVSDTGGFVEGGSGHNDAQDSLTFAYNVSINNGDLSVLHNGGNHFAAVFTNVLFINNTVIDTTGSPTEVWFSSEATSAQVTYRNNIFWQPAGRVFQNAGTLNHDHNIFSAGATLGVTMGSDEHVGEPGFVDAAGLDFHLTESSIAVDVGADTVFGADFDGTAVPTGAGVDIGAYEYSAGGPPMDGGVGMIDASPIDWGMPGADSGTGPMDGGTGVTDMGSHVSDDAGTGTPDSGTGGGGGGAPASGCGVAAESAPDGAATFFLLAGLGLLGFVVRRRRTS